MSELRTGYTTGACSTAAVKACVLALTGAGEPSEVIVTLGEGVKAKMPVHKIGPIENNGYMASVIKDAGDDPDITNGRPITAEVFFIDEGEILFEAGTGVGMVTRPGLSVPVGEPAINPGPRRMITGAVREVTKRPVRVRLSIPGGERLAAKTFNPRLGVMGGLSILGTTGIVRPFSHSAVKESILCLMNVAIAESGLSQLVLTPGNIGRRAAIESLKVEPKRVVEVGNEWGYIIGKAVESGVTSLALIGHAGKLAKLAMGHWDTHSKNSPTAAPYVLEIARNKISPGLDDSATVEGVFDNLNESDRDTLGDLIAGNIRNVVIQKTAQKTDVEVVIVNMKSEIIGSCGNELWIR